MNNTTVIPPGEMRHMEGHIVPKYFNAGFVVLSYLISYLGAMTTLELLMRRTSMRRESMRGLYNWFLLLGASISMGGIAIWSMHFIGNYAITLGHGEAYLQIVYSPGFTALSFFIPITVTFLAFAAVGTDEFASMPRVVIGGILAGFGICGMHYMGQTGITNYTCEYRLGFVLLSVLIACVACIVALGTFFVFFSSWNAALWKRALTANVLAIGVSGMHWLASSETEYKLKTSVPSKNALSPLGTVIAVIVFAVIACLGLISFALLSQAKRVQFARRARQVTLTTAIFNNEGKLLVAPDGMIPTRKVTNAYLERSVNDQFGVSNPIFHWIFRTTFNWASIIDLIPTMRAHLRRTGIITHRIGATGERKLLKESGTPIDDYLMIFRELFCVAAADLAKDLKQPVERLGMLFDDVVSVGLKDGKESKGKRKGSSAVDVEQVSKPVEGKGQLLFLVKIVSGREADQIQAAGFRFSPVAKVAPFISSSLIIGQSDLIRRLDMMREYGTGYQILDQGVHIAFFAIRASMASGFDVLSRKDAKNQLPTVQLPYDSLEPWQVDYLKTMENLNVAACIKHLRKASLPSNPSAMERQFAGTFVINLEALRDEIDDVFFNDAVLIAEPIKAPCRGHTDDSPPSTAQLIAFRIFVPVHGRAPGTRLAFTPLNFFKVQQQVYHHSEYHETFALKTHREFAPFVELIGPISTEKDTRPSAEVDDETGTELLPKSRLFVSATDQELEPKTFVDELFEICIKAQGYIVR
ncbi:Signaling protein [Lachnellula suecica]|uniref:Signaling protein n=1 Tax=Lachnellula suecica TaxID=602035 RepID=A0A8T9C2Y3_9HELO|nr:Signaling protein [Lachnellula suecica]